ncbi:MAG: HipA domain-containing protein [Oligoflexia bacterium]|nr:HipA domain-containing protein [Oligoflexia bacterium]
MTSDAQPSECYVYITLPGQTQPITAGRFELTTTRAGVPLGRFVYGKHYLENPEAVEFDPIELRLTPRTYETTILKGVFGAIRDAGPDYWGRRVIERNTGKAQFGEMHYLLHSPDDRAGALGFGLNRNPPAPRRHFNQTLHLEKLQAIADAIVADEELPPDAVTGQIENLMLIGTSMGGGRPKAVVEDADGLWLAKFNRTDDRWNNARVEHAMLQLARSCGIATAESRIVSVGGRDVLLVKRFDREKAESGYLRARMVSGLTLLRAEEFSSARDNWSYVLLAEEVRRASSQPDADARELFKRMCFNALISNSDDHPRNHAIIAKNRTWKLSPVYDLTPTTPISMERRDLAMVVGDAGRFANAENLLSQCQRFLVKRDQAETLVKEMAMQVKATWYQAARGCGVSEAHCKLLSDAFAYPGFDLPLPKA